MRNRLFDKITGMNRRDLFRNGGALAALGAMRGGSAPAGAATLDIGKRLAELTGAEWGIVTAGCAAAITHVTAACIAGSDPEKMQRLPNLHGLKSEVIIPQYSRNEYDHAVRMLGVKIIEPKDRAEYEAAFNERTAMVYILAGR